MNKKKLNTFKTDHPIIKEISIGDKFVLNNGFIVTFVGYRKNFNVGTYLYPFTMLDIYDLQYTFSKDLKFDLSIVNHKFNIKYKIIPLKEKLDLI